MKMKLPEEKNQIFARCHSVISRFVYWWWKTLVVPMTASGSPNVERRMSSVVGPTENGLLDEKRWAA